jgi:hypothetical protein
MTNKDEFAALKAEVAAQRARVDELERAAKPPEPFKPMSDAEWRDRMHQAAERRMAMATPPSVIRDFAVLDDRLVKDIALRDARAPINPSGMIPNSQQVGGPAPSSTPGWVDPTPLRPPPGINWVDAQLIADDVKQRGKGKR